ncbi:DUF7289 family protein [Haladaptatus sp. CMSO5]|uniref:DUF7289 family protein n=1 Tax=Haladaptatus sp. CMSO5 TaxID=3120514 RepID=UPI002FCDE349
MGTKGGMGAQQRAQSELLGFLLVTVLSIAMVSFMVITASGGIASVQATAEVSKAETAMGVFDMRASAVTLGESDLQTVAFGNTGEGELFVDEDEGSMVIIHTDLDGHDTVLYNNKLGALVYRQGDTEIAYQGGGIWRLDESGQARMISAPEFHYREATLTVPVIRVTGDGSVSGDNAQIQATRGATGQTVFPDASRTLANGEPWSNPGAEGSMTIVVQSRYYEGWAQYFETRTEGTVTVDAATQTVTLDLTVPYDMGWFRMPEEGDSLHLRAVDEDHPLSEFTVTMYPDDSDSAWYNNLKWSFVSKQVDEEFEIHLRSTGNAPDDGEACDKKWVGITIYYENGSTYEGWQIDEAFKTSCYDADNDGVADESYLYADLNSMDVTMDYSSISSNDVVGGASGVSLDADRRAASDAFNEGQDTELGLVLSNYLGEVGPDIDLTVVDKSAQTINESISEGTIHYDQRSYTLYFLHITENTVDVELR